ncbi:hypothetical protein [Streptomyces anulatus]|uniref:hypothetical protein n=1 Tax=Streptomyces anulatus TaxID=1892 RepID=UPI002F908F38
MRERFRVGLISASALSVIIGSIAATPAQSAEAAAVTTVAVTLANSADITQTSDGATELTEFATRNTASLDGATPGDIGTLRSKYKVLNVDMTKVLNLNS